MQAEREGVPGEVEDVARFGSKPPTLPSFCCCIILGKVAGLSESRAPCKTLNHR